jgi:AcrR family transcriptional regulator
LTPSNFGGNVIPVNVRAYHQGERAAAAEERTRRILEAALELFVELPFDKITLAAVAQRADVGLQTLIRRVGTKDGLVQAVNTWIVTEIGRDRGAPTDEPAEVAAAMARHHVRWGEVIARTLQQEDSTPSLKASADFGRRAHHDWIAACFGERLRHLRPTERRRCTAQLVGITGTELWRVLTRDEGLSAAQARIAVTELIEATLVAATRHGAPT